MWLTRRLRVASCFGVVDQRVSSVLSSLCGHNALLVKSALPLPRVVAGRAFSGVETDKGVGVGGGTNTGAGAGSGAGGSQPEEAAEEGEGKASASSSWLPSFLLKDRIVAGPKYSRWLVPPAAIGTHLCIGSVYAWSIFNAPLTRELGVVASASDDWALGSVVPIFSSAIVCLGLSAAVAGSWLEKVGPRAVGVVAACCWGGGFLVGGLGVLWHSLPLLYLGYGVLGGCGLGLGYVSPVSTLLRWFPDRRGMATGMAIMGFGGGAMIGAPIKQALLAHYYKAPQYLGSADGEVSLVTQGGRRLAEVGGELQEVVVATASEAAASCPGLAEGVYLVGSGNTGAASTFFTLGAAYSAVMLASAFAYRVPAEGWRPEGWVEPSKKEEDEEEAAATSSAAAAASPMVTRNHVHIDTALRTPQFWLLWATLGLNVTAGIGVLGVAKTMMGEIFGTTLPHIVDGAFAATYVTMISAFNMSGRFLWASASDYLGRKRTYFVFFGLGIPLYLTIPAAAAWASGAGAASVLPLALFYGSTMVIFTMYGGGFATIPAYLADIFGTKYVGGIHGRLLTAWSTAGIVGPLAITKLRKASVDSAISDLSQQVDPGVFEAKFGAGLGQLQALVDAKTVTIARLMEIAPAGTVDPTPFLYNSTMYSMAGLLAVAAIANALVRPVDPKYHLPEKSE